MDKVQVTVLNYCVESARNGNDKIDIFELFYDTGIAFDELSKALAELKKQKEIEQTDVKFYKFTGDINREIEDTENSSQNDAEQQKQTEEINEYHIKALQLCIEQGMASVSLVQRNFPVGFLKACKIIDWMETMGYITKALGSKPRKLIITQDEFDLIYGGKNLSDTSSGAQSGKRQNETILGSILRKRWECSDLDDVTVEDVDENSEEDLEEYEKKDFLDSIDWSFNFEESITDPSQDTADSYLRKLNGAFTLEKTEEGVFVKANFKYKTGFYVKFRLIICDGSLMLTDEGFAKCSISGKSGVGSMRADNLINKAIKDTRIDYKLNELRITTEDSTAITDFMYLYSIIEGLL